MNYCKHSTNSIISILSLSEASDCELLSTFNHKESAFSVLGVPIAGDINSVLNKLVDQSVESIKPLRHLKQAGRTGRVEIIWALHAREPPSKSDRAGLLAH